MARNPARRRLITVTRIKSDGTTQRYNVLPSTAAKLRAQNLLSDATRPSTETPPRGKATTPVSAPTGPPRSRARERAVIRVEGGEFRRNRGGTLSTWFNALGTTGRIVDMENNPESPRLLQEDHEVDEFAAPAAFYSNEAGLLGQVKWRGYRTLRGLIADLNLRLQFLGEERAGFDFRRFYNQWEYKYQVVERIGDVDIIRALVVRTKPKRPSDGVFIDERKVGA